MKITSVNNPKVVYWGKLKMKKYRDIENAFLVEGEHLVKEALKKKIVKEIITVDDSLYPIPTYNVTLDVMKRITSMISPPKIMAVCSYILPDDIKGNYLLLLDHLQDPGNLGTIIRSAVAFGFETIIMSSSMVDIYNDKVIRSSEGMLFNINIIKSDLESIIPLLKAKGYKVIGTDVKKGSDIKTYKEEKCAFIIGSEGSGMSLDIKEMCDDFVYIKMSPKCESLNAAVAASILMYEARHE